MFRKTDQYLLTRYPLLWNMRLHILLPLIAVLHVLFYTFGYFRHTSLHSLVNDYYDLRAEGSVYVMAALLAVLIIVVWLVFYLRNNAFKSFYPLKKGRLFAEFLLIILILLGVSTFALSWQKGLYDNLRALTHDTDLKKEADIANLAAHFIPFSKKQFSISGCCDSIIKHEQDSSYTDRSNYEDTLPEKYSYLYYCNAEVSLSTDAVRGQFDINEIATRWLVNGRRDSVKWVLDQYLGICDKYGAAYKFKTTDQVKACFNTPDFRVQTEVSDNSYDYEQEGPSRGPYITRQEVSSSLRRTDEIRENLYNAKTTLGYIYLCACAALVLLSFRLTKLRTWFIAAIGLGLWGMFFGLIAGLSGGNESFIALLFFALVIIFLVYAIVNINMRRNKLFSGLSFLWFTWVLPGVVPFFFMFLQYAVFRRDNYVYDQAGNREYIGPDPAYEWIEDHWMHIHIGNLVFVILMTACVIIPLARKWQANPEE